MKRLNTVMDVEFKMLTEKDWDNVTIIDGDEGKGKSNLGLLRFEYWYNKLLEAGMISIEEFTEELIKFIALDMESFVEGFKELRRYFKKTYDEAGDLSNLRQMNKFNYLVTKSYKVLRGYNTSTDLILPSVFELNPFFTKRRARGLIHVYARGRLAYWNKPRLRQLLDVNRVYKRKSVWRVKPLFHDTFPRYDGILKEIYGKRKQEKMEQEKENLYNEFKNKEAEQDKELLRLYRAKLLVGTSTTSDIWMVHENTVRNRLKGYKPPVVAPPLRKGTNYNNT